MKVWSSACGDVARRLGEAGRAVVLAFGGPRRVLSTSPFNGGLRTDLRQAFNYSYSIKGGEYCTMRAPTYAEHLALIAREIGLDPAVSVGLSTSAKMGHLAILEDGWGSAEVAALVTAGLDVNAGRSGDPADWDEEAERRSAPPTGTVNVILHFSCDLSEGALTRALITLTEAKAAALQELAVPSRYSHGIATGSGTDGAIVVANAASSLRLTDTGNHSKLGSAVGRVVKAAVKEALRLQSGLTPQSQHGILRRTERFGVTEESLWARYRRRGGGLDRARFATALAGLDARDGLLTSVSLAVHLMDQAEWGLLSPDEALSAALRLLAAMGVCVAPSGSVHDAHDAEEAVAFIAGAVSDALVRLAAADGGDFREGAPCGQRRGMIDYERPVPVVDGKGGA